MTANKLRQEFLDFFVKKGHKIIPSASLIPPTEVELAGTQRVLFTTAGMHPLIPYLLGKEHAEGKRLVNIQKCLRTDDISEVGDAWHNTFFEMLGNWSLGDYGKVEAITWSFEFLTKVLGVGKDKIWVTVFGGDKQLPGIPEDSESAAIWKNLGIESGQIIKLGKKDNWWGPVGVQGPCGPDCEMFVDVKGVPHGKSCKPGDDCGRFSEVWNDVFMEFNKTKDGKYEPLKQKNVDTGMGVERTLAILQGKDNVYDTELFQEAMRRIKEKSNNFELRKARIIADHLRASTFLIADGVEPASADDRGSVLVRLLTNVITKGREIGIEGSFASWIADAFIDLYQKQYPELGHNRLRINNTVSQMEERYLFKVQSAKALKLENLRIAAALENPRETTAGTATTVSGYNWTFAKLHNKFQSLPTISGAIGSVSAELQTTYGIPPEEFFRVAEEILSARGKKFKREDALTNLDIIQKLHQEVSRQSGKQRFVGGLADHSAATIAGHTATHLLHQALRDVLGIRVYQTGSNITAERIRFDFFHGEKLTLEQIKQVEELVNQKIAQRLPVVKEIISLEKAKRIGAIGLFGEKYGQTVSVYFIGEYSKEFCAGPHVKSTKELGRFKIIKEESQGATTRRIYAKLEN